MKDKTIAVLGLAFKPNTDDMRLAPSLEIIRPLLQDGARIKAYDPKAMDNARAILPELEYCEDSYAAATDAEALVVCTEWQEFRDLDLDRIKSVMAQPIILDGRNIFAANEMVARGFIYHGIGRRAVDGR